jgi:hypothetical protein
VEVALKQWGKTAYVLAADYNYGQITSKWLTHYITKGGGKVLQSSFFPLDVSDFGSTIAKIQQEKPKFVVAALVGGAHMSFFRQWAASGMNKKIPLCSTTFGVGNEHLALSAAEGDGILIAAAFVADPRLGIAAALAVMAHEVPHHVGDLVVLRQTLSNPRAALFKLTLAGGVTAIGGLVGYLLVGALHEYLPFFLVVAASSFIYVALADLIPQLQKRLSPRETAAQVAWLFAGIALVAALGEWAQH